MLQNAQLQRSQPCVEHPVAVAVALPRRTPKTPANRMAKACHPDAGCSTEQQQALNTEYQNALGRVNVQGQGRSGENRRYCTTISISLEFGLMIFCTRSSTFGSFPE